MGIVDAVGSENFPLPHAVLMNAMYEMEAWCTSIVAK